MPIQEAEAFVLNTYDFRDYDKVAVFYSRQVMPERPAA